MIGCSYAALRLLCAGFKFISLFFYFLFLVFVSVEYVNEVNFAISAKSREYSE